MNLFQVLAILSPLLLLFNFSNIFFSNTDYLYNIYEKYTLCFNRTSVLNQRYAGKFYNSDNINNLNLKSFKIDLNSAKDLLLLKIIYDLGMKNFSAYIYKFE